MTTQHEALKRVSTALNDLETCVSLGKEAFLELDSANINLVAGMVGGIATDLMLTLTPAFPDADQFSIIPIEDDSPLKTMKDRYMQSCVIYGLATRDFMNSLALVDMANPDENNSVNSHLAEKLADAFMEYPPER